MDWDLNGSVALAEGKWETHPQPPNQFQTTRWRKPDLQRVVGPHVTTIRIRGSAGHEITQGRVCESLFFSEPYAQHVQQAWCHQLCFFGTSWLSTANLSRTTRQKERVFRFPLWLLGMVRSLCEMLVFSLVVASHHGRRDPTFQQSRFWLGAEPRGQIGYTWARILGNPESRVFQGVRKNRLQGVNPTPWRVFAAKSPQTDPVVFGKWNLSTPTKWMPIKPNQKVMDLARPSGQGDQLK